MANPQVISLEPTVLIWARESLGLSQVEAAAAVKRPVAEVVAWEAGESSPSFAQLETLARKVYKRPLAVFFMKAPPQVPSLQEDFRTVGSTAFAKLSAKTRLSLRRIRAKREYLKELFGTDDFTRSPMYRLEVAIGDDVEVLTQQVRSLLEFPFSEQQKCQNAYGVFNALRGALELQRVFVFQDALDDVRGVAMYDERFPLIGVNGADHIAARCFTIAHELGHILLRQGDVLQDDIDAVTHSATEQFCNAFASEMLLPSDVFEAALQQVESILKTDALHAVKLIANQALVSNTLVARRLKDLKKLSQKEYSNIVGIFSNNYLNKKKEQKKREGGPSPYLVRSSRLGATYLTKTYELLERGAISEQRASEILGTKIEHLDKLASQLERS